MIKFFANVIEQLDFAVDHVILEDVNYKRLALMLIDNAMELTLHQYVKGEGAKLRYAQNVPISDQKLLKEALGQRFDPKVKFAKRQGLLSEDVATSISILHSYRNQVYHQGLMHGEILHALAVFYFRIACDVLAAFKSTSYGWGTGDKIPHRAIKYIGGSPRDSRELIAKAWVRLKEVSDAVPFNLLLDLETEVAAMVKETDRLIDYLANGDPAKPSRDQVVLDSQAWHIAFTDKGKEYAAKHKNSGATVASYVDWFAQNYPFSSRIDPIPSWTARLSSLRTETNEHMVLKKYQDFVTQTEDLRESVDVSAAAFDLEVERQIEAARGL